MSEHEPRDDLGVDVAIDADDDVEIEPDRHELRAGLPYHFAFSRREFVGTVGTGVVVLVIARRGSAGPLLEGDVAASRALRDPVSTWLHVAGDGVVTVYTGKVEVGQDIRTSLTQSVADELGSAPGAVRLVMGDTDLTPYDAGTFGSRSTPQMTPLLRRAAAAAREIIVARAAQQWGVAASTLVVRDGRVVGAGRSAGIGEVTAGEKLVQEIPADLPIRGRTQWTIAGTSIPKVGARDIVTGTHRYTSDMRLPRMLIGKVLRPPSFGARMIAADLSAAEAMAGVTVVRDGDFVGVAAPDEVTATRALAAIRAQWESVPQPSQRELFAHLKRTATGRADASRRSAIDSALAAADERVDATYTTAYIAHVPLEPRAAVAQWEDGKLTVWTGTQRPFGVRTELVRALRVPEERVRVIVPDTGSGYGGKHTGETAIEAARLARAAERPVRVVWSRDEEFTYAYFRPAALIEIRAGVTRDGTLTAWEFHNYNAGNAGIRMSYDVAQQHVVHQPSDTPLRQGSYRALAATANTFARELHVHELAVRVGMDPLEFRLRNLRDERMRNVLNAAAERFGWRAWLAAHAGTQNASGTNAHGIGIACGSEKGGYVATCAEVEVDRASGRLQLLRLVEAFECGAIVSPDGLHNQVEGALIMGLGGALWEAIEFADGRVLNPRLSQYRVPRFSDVPAIDIVLLDRRDLPSAGAGETPIITVAPAIAAAVQRATGEWLRSLPLAPHGVRVSAKPGG
ncbi:MAG TPA: molybdopterin cofactor-binding domain-containing protein [Longimicrobiales bacterium]|nr:molybdopterin cofactor-binding domain-containing protein [Longimicrobiales bacterium]